MYKKKTGRNKSESRTESNRDSSQNDIAKEPESKEEIAIKLKSDRIKYSLRIVFLIVINSVLFGLLIKSSSSVTQNIFSALNANLIGFNVLGLLLGIFVALLPYKGLRFKEKYLRSFLLATLSIQITLTGALALIALLRLVGWY